MVTAEFAYLQEHGVDLGSDGKMYPVVIGNKGDWSYLKPWFLKQRHVLVSVGLPCDPFLSSSFIHLRYHQQTWSDHTEEVPGVQAMKHRKEQEYVTCAWEGKLFSGRI